MTANDWILPWFMLVRIMYIMLNQSAAFAVQATRRFVPDWPPPSPGSLSPPPGKPHPTLINDVSMWALSLYVKSTDDYAHL